MLNNIKFKPLVRTVSIVYNIRRKAIVNNITFQHLAGAFLSQYSLNKEEFKDENE